MYKQQNPSVLVSKCMENFDFFFLFGNAVISWNLLNFPSVTTRGALLK